MVSIISTPVDPNDGNIAYTKQEKVTENLTILYFVNFLKSLKLAKVKKLGEIQSDRQF